MCKQRRCPALSPSPQYIPFSLDAKLELHTHNEHQFLHCSPYDLNSVCSSIDPLLPYHLTTSFFHQPTLDLTTNIASKHFAFKSNLDSSPQIVLDSGASLSITPDSNDFIEPIQPSRIRSISGLNSSEKVQGCGKIRWIVKDVNDAPFAIETFALHIPTASIRLFSPQDYFHQISCPSTVHMDQSQAFLNVDKFTIAFPYHKDNNLPMTSICSADSILHAVQNQLSFLSSYSSNAIIRSVTDNHNQNISREQKNFFPGTSNSDISTSNGSKLSSVSVLGFIH